MLISAAAFGQYVLALHIIGVVVAFGALFAYPLVAAAGSRLDPAALPAFHRLQVSIVRYLVNPGLLVVLLAGIYIASDLHQWKAFYVQWGVAAVVVLGGLAGSALIPVHKRLAELAAAGPRTAEYAAAARRARLLTWLSALIVVVTVVLMSVQAGATTTA